jgi:hypothetical protein
MIVGLVSIEYLSNAYTQGNARGGVDRASLQLHPEAGQKSYCFLRVSHKLSLLCHSGIRFRIRENATHSNVASRGALHCGFR